MTKNSALKQLVNKCRSSPSRLKPADVQMFSTPAAKCHSSNQWQWIHQQGSQTTRFLRCVDHRWWSAEWTATSLLHPNRHVPRCNRPQPVHFWKHVFLLVIDSQKDTGLERSSFFSFKLSFHPEFSLCAKRPIFGGSGGSNFSRTRRSQPASRCATVAVPQKYPAN